MIAKLTHAIHFHSQRGREDALPIYIRGLVQKSKFCLEISWIAGRKTRNITHIFDSKISPLITNVDAKYRTNSPYVLESSPPPPPGPVFILN